MMNFYYTLISLFTGILSCFLGIFCYLKNPKSITNKIWALLNLSIGFWAFSTFMMMFSRNHASGLFWCRMLHFGAIFIPIFYLHFAFSLSNYKKRDFLIVGYILTNIFLVLNFTNLVIKDAIPKLSFRFYPVGGIFYPPFLLMFISFPIYGLIRLILKRREAIGFKKEQLTYVVIASFIAFVGGSTNYPLVLGINIYPIGHLFGIIIYIVLISYAIVKFRLMDISVIITRATIFIVVYALVLGLPFVLSAFGKVWLIKFLGPNWWLGPLVLMATLGTVGPFIYLYLKRSVEAILLREQFRYKNTLSQAAEEMAHIFGLKKLLDFMAHVLTASVRISHAAIYLYNTEGRQFLLNTARNIKSGLPQAIGKESLLIDWLESQKMPLVYEEVKRHVQERQVADFDFEEIEKALRALQASVVIPSLLEDRLLGFIVLGDKRSGRIYANEDLSTLLVLGSQFALAVENASLYNNLEEQVSQRTKELIDMQKQLIQAEKLASVGTLAGGVAHEINNPLAAILTNVQMLLADSNAADEDTKESLELIEEATKRCRTIVQKLMAYAKKPLETTEFTEVNLLKAVKNVVSFLGYQLEQENVKFSVNANEDNYWVKGNQNEIEQLVTNIVLNARDAIKRIKKSGVIQIDLVKNEKWITTEIKDEGAGISKEIIPKIFDPFFTTKDVGKGLGLGLSICQAIAERHNGKINVKSEVNRGSTFIVQLPRAKVGSRIESEVGSQRKLES